MNQKTFSNDELQAYVDGELDPQRRTEIDALLVSDPQAARQVNDYRLIQQRLHAQFDPVLQEDAEVLTGVSADYFMPLKASSGGGVRGLARAAVIAFIMLASGFLGWSLRGTEAVKNNTVAYVDLVKPATFAHQIYSTDEQYPVEIPAIRRVTLNQWLSKRIHAVIQAPDLTTEGFNLIGGRLLPSTNRMAAQFMYEDDQGGRLTVYIRRISSQADTSFEYMEQGDLHIFYWIDKSMGYAVIGTSPASQLISVANVVNSSLSQP